MHATLRGPRLTACALGFALALLAGSCFTPTVYEGQFQCEGGSCPRGLECSGSPRYECVLPGSQLPSVDGGGADGQGPAADGARGDAPVGPGSDAPGADAPGSDGPAGDTGGPGTDGPGPGLSTISVGENLDDHLRNVTLDSTADEATPDVSGAGDASIDARADTNVASTGEISYRREIAMIRFELAALQGGEVVEAELRLHVQTGEDAVRFHEMLVPWDQNATFNQASQGVAWPAAGCENVAGGAPCYQEPEFFVRSFDIKSVVEAVPVPAALVQRWIDDPSTNHGIMIRINLGETGGQVEFSSSEASNGNRPRLVVQLRGPGGTFDGGTPDLPGLPDGGATDATVDATPDLGNLCGNGALDTGEACDGTLLGGQTCQSRGFRAGTLRCAAGCGALDLSGCSNVRINEVESNPSPDWVELYNPGPGDADLSGYSFTDNTPDDPTHRYTFAPGTVLPAGGYLFRLGDTDFTFGLGSADLVRLFEPGGTMIDELSWSAHAGGTLARCPDGSENVVDVSAPTQGASNATSCP